MITAENINVYNNKILIEQPNEADVNISALFRCFQAASVVGSVVL